LLDIIEIRKKTHRIIGLMTTFKGEIE